MQSWVSQPLRRKGKKWQYFTITQLLFISCLIKGLSFICKMGSTGPIRLPTTETGLWWKPSIIVKSFINIILLGCVYLEMVWGVMTEGNSIDLDLYEIFSRKVIQSFIKSGADTLEIIWSYHTSTIYICRRTRVSAPNPFMLSTWALAALVWEGNACEGQCELSFLSTLFEPNFMLFSTLLPLCWLLAYFFFVFLLQKFP